MPIINNISLIFMKTVWWKKLLIVVFFSFLPSGYIFWQNYSELKSTLAQVKDQFQMSIVALNHMKHKASNLAVIEKKVKATQLEWNVLSKKLPSSFHIDIILKKTAILAKNNGVRLDSFIPRSASIKGEDFKYIRKPIELKIFGTFQDIASFLNDLTHLKLVVHIGNFVMSLSHMKEKDNGLLSKLTNIQKEEKSRLDSRVSCTVNILIFRTLSIYELRTINPVKKKEASNKSA